MKLMVAAAGALLLLPVHASARFLSVDPVHANQDNGSNFNRYAYANNNPYAYTDPDGRFAVQLGGGVPGGGPIATGLRAGLASGNGNVLQQGLDRGFENIDPKEAAAAATLGALVGGTARVGAERLIPNRNIPGLPASHPLVQQGRAVAQQGSEAAAKPMRDAAALAASTGLGASVAGAQAVAEAALRTTPEIERKQSESP